MRSVKSKCNFVFLHRCCAGRYKGVTLVELMVAFSLIVIIFAAIVPQFRAIRNSWAGAEAAASIIQNGRVLSEHITRNLSAANKVVSVSLASQVQGYITFADANDDSYRYMYSGGYVVFGPVGSEEQLAGPVSRFQIASYSVYPSFAAATDVNDIRYVEIETDFTNSDPLGTDKTFKTGVFLRTNLDDDCGIVGYWKLNETSGNTAVDSSGYGNHGTLINMESTDWVDGRINGGLDPDGGNEYVNCGNDSSLDITANITIALWVKPDSFSNEPDLVTKGLYNEAYTIWLYSDGRVILALNNQRFYSETAVTTGEWYHIAVTRGGNEWKIYINGKEDASGTYGTAISTTSRDLTFSSTGYDYDGIMDDIRIYNRALNPDEIVQLANSVVFRSFEETKSLGNTTSLTISTPNDVNEDDLLIAAVAVDGDVSSSLSPPGGENWTEIDVGDYTSGAETPSVTHDNSGRQCLVGFVVNAESSSDPVGIIGSWETDAVAPITHAKETGTNRALAFFAHAEPSDSRTLNTVTYGGQAMTRVVHRAGSGGSSRAYVAAFILNDVGITAATTTTFSPTWSSSAPASVTYSSVFLENVDQTTLTGASADATVSGTTISTSSLAVGKGDMVIEAAACSTAGIYTMNNGFTKAFELSASSYYDGVGGYKSAGGTVTLGAWWKLADIPGATSHQFSWSGSRQAYGWIMCFAGHDEADPINASSTDNDSDDTPTSPSVDPDAINCMILRLGAFDNGDIMVYPTDESSLPDDHFPITMDRSVPALFEDGFEGTPWDAQWTTNWERDNNPVYSGDYSANADRNDDDLTSDNINTSGYSSFVVSFWYRQDHIESDDNVYLQFYNGSGYDNIFNLDDSTGDQWNYYTITITDAQYIRTNFRIRFTANMNSSEEDVWIDDVAVYGSEGVSGGAGYRIQDVAGASGTSNFTLGAPNEARMITVAVKPGALCEEPCCGETIKP